VQTHDARASLKRGWSDILRDGRRPFGHDHVGTVQRVRNHLGACSRVPPGARSQPGSRALHEAANGAAMLALLARSNPHLPSLLSHPS
jgi:hypothetical protein